MGAQYYLQPNTAVTVYNTTYVSKNGNDSTGKVQRLDKPFLTIDAATIAIVAYFDGSTPLRPAIDEFHQQLMVILPGYYQESIVAYNYINYDLTSATIESLDDSQATIVDNNNVTNSRIYGNGNILRKGNYAVDPYAVTILNAASNISIICNKIDATASGSGVSAVYNNGASFIQANEILADNYCIQNKNTIKVISNISGVNDYSVFADAGAVSTIIYGNCNTSGANGVFNNSGNMFIYGNINSQSIAVNNGISAGTTIIRGNINIISFSSSGVQCFGGTQIVYGDVSSVGSLAVSINAGTQKIYGNVSGTTNVVNTILGGSGLQYVFGNVTATGANAASCNSGKQIIIGDISTTGSNAAFCQVGTQIIYGNLQSVTIGTIQISSGIAFVYGNVTCTTAGRAVNCSGVGSVTVNGNVTAPGQFAVFAGVNGSVVTINGNVSGANQAVATGGATAEITINGNVTGTGQVIEVGATGGRININNGKITATVSTCIGNLLPGIVAINSCTLIAGTFCVQALSTIKVYGTCQANLAPGAGVVQQVGAINVNVLVT